MLMGCAACKKVAYSLKDKDCMTNRGCGLNCEPKKDCQLLCWACLETALKARVSEA
jgi:hypothetical protein